NPKPIKGYIYLDKNKNDEMDKEEKGIENVSIRIYRIYEGNEITIAQLKTDENGYWESEVCPGDYSIEIDQESLPKNLKTEEVLSVNVEDQEITLDISATDTRNFWQKYWYIILLVAALLITTVYIVATRKKEEVYNQ
ncbi:MAG: SdrD B-like domain-containing protein, partial [Candidatus Dojkabacteria bacterium]|nr:SdrD B-like domain-containing protein [Candidatus Dojkabacteria bacterium]